MPLQDYNPFTAYRKSYRRAYRQANNKSNSYVASNNYSCFDDDDENIDSYDYSNSHNEKQSHNTSNYYIRLDNSYYSGYDIMLSDIREFPEYWILFKCNLRAQGCFVTIQCFERRQMARLHKYEEGFVRQLLFKTLHPVFVKRLKNLVSAESLALAALFTLQDDFNRLITPRERKRADELRRSMNSFDSVFNYCTVRCYFRRYEKILKETQRSSGLGLLLTEKEITRHCLQQFTDCKKNKYISKKLDRRFMYAFRTFNEMKSQILAFHDHHQRNRSLGFGVIYEFLVCIF
ncbi:unnamed protein product [Ambrosiozyma monospora]|uniref:Unnamed protein product n=1 Tax=Ambrosiozyma monospora TaxID=43982 RepID=A0A9W6YXW0_AMBMO|nr:unnamed protein product [Ambrosiozyma monospora]